ncbi:MAG: WbqC family protein [Deltaproteobacteria bacterium]|nr:WbqC family protein [Deltaproteobacteria bacterium]
MRLVGHQPEFLPWLGFFHKLTLGDLYMIVDNVQFKKKHFENRNRIRTPEGWIWLTVPVQTHGHFTQPINAVCIDNRTPWRRKILRSIELNYQRAPYFSDYWPFFREVFSREWERLTDLNEVLIRGCLEFLDIHVGIVKSSELKVQGHATDLIIQMCKVVKADTYVSGQSGKDYLDTQVVAESNIKLIYQAFQHPEYRQITPPFVPQMSVIDILFNEGEKAKEYVRLAGTYEDYRPS